MKQNKIPELHVKTTYSVLSVIQHENISPFKTVSDFTRELENITNSP